MLATALREPAGHLVDPYNVETLDVLRPGRGGLAAHGPASRKARANPGCAASIVPSGSFKSRSIAMP